MPGIRPLQKALLYAPNASGRGPRDLSARLAPPYDMADAALADRLIQSDPQNAIILESPQDAFPDLAVDEAHQRARQSLDVWMSDGTLRQHPVPAYVLTRLTYSNDGSVHRRLGLTALVPIEAADSTDEPGPGLLAHEERSPHFEVNRFDHLAALRCQSSPVLALYDDEYGDVETCLRTHMIKREPTFNGRTSDGVAHEAWIMDDAHEMNLLEHAFDSRPLVIADGHNRYQAHIRYLAQHDHLSPNHPARWCAANLVARQDDGLLVRSMYHVYSGIHNYDFDAILEKAAEVGEVCSVSASLPDLLPHLEQAWMDRSHPIGIHDLASGRSAIFTTRQIDPLARRFPNRPEDWRRADAVILEHLLLRPILHVDANGIRPVPHEAVSQFAGHHVSPDTGQMPQLVATVLPVSAETIIDLASVHCLLPPFTTHFWPTFPAGFVFHSLE